MRKLAVVLVLALAAATGAGSMPSAQPSAQAQSRKVPRWDREQINISISDQLLRGPQNIRAGTDILAAVNAGINAWHPFVNIQFTTSASDKLSVSPKGVRGDGVSLITMAPTFENASMFADGKLDVAAKTRVFTDRRGNITEADIVLNPFAQFSSDGSFGTFDLEAVITHEIGHLLGLDHSEIAGSVMYKNIELNGVIYGDMPIRKSISASDAAMLRSVYGVSGGDDKCCGRVSGRLNVSGRDVSRFSVWLQDEFGRAAASTGRLQGNTFVVGGIPDGVYKAFVAERRRNGRTEQVLADTIEVRAGRTTTLTAKRSAETADFGISLIGRGDSLSESPLLLDAGFDGDVFVGGDNISAGRLDFFSDSPYVTIDNSSSADIDFSDKVSVVRLRVRIDAAAAGGSYTIFARSPGGAVSALVGSLFVSSGR